MSIIKDIFITVYQLFSINHLTPKKSYNEKKITQLNKKKQNIPPHIIIHLKNAKKQLEQITVQIERLPKEEQYILRKIYELCSQLIELVQICPSSYNHIRPFFNGYLQSILEVIEEFTYLVNRQKYSTSFGNKINVCVNSLHETYKNLMDIYNQGLILETEELYQKINHLNILMREDITKKGDVLFFEENKIDYRKGLCGTNGDRIQILK